MSTCQVSEGLGDGNRGAGSEGSWSAGCQVIQSHGSYVHAIYTPCLRQNKAIVFFNILFAVCM